MVLKRKIAYFEATSLVGDEYQNSGVKYLEAKLDRITEAIRRDPNEKFVVVIDEIMRLAEKHQNEKGEGKDIATKLWLTMDKFKRSNNVFFIATANDIDGLPEQISSRFSKNNVIEVSVPNKDYRRKILLNCLSDQHSLSNEELENLVYYTDGLTHRQIESIVQEGALLTAMKTGNVQVISYENLEEAIGAEKNISFMGRWVYDPVNNWFVNPVNNWVILPFNKFCKNNKETLQNVRDVSVTCGAIFGIGAGIVIVFGSGGTAAPAMLSIKAALAAQGVTKSTVITGGLLYGILSKN